ncbi:hypothetical protein [Candidiatus Paracoxiella cheracis]|uniref:hypothetical protein n=1 Tax=Candidiatus Paracoxiella cheracis TaxID=3405120 RepID=UPI003BF54EF2
MTKQLTQKKAKVVQKAKKAKKATQKTMGRPTKYSPEMCGLVLEFMREGKSLAEVSLDLNIDYLTLHRWQDPSSKYYKPDFCKAIKKGKWFAQGAWEKAGREGLDKKDFNCALWYMNMKNRFGWRDKQEIKQDVKQTIELSGIDEEMLNDSKKAY